MTINRFLRHLSIKALVLAALALLLLSGCQGRGSATAEDAAVKSILKSPPVGAVIDATSFETLQTQVFEGSTYVVLTYHRLWNERDEQCLTMLETHYELLTGWVGGSGGGSCAERDATGSNLAEPMHLSGGSHSRKDQNKPDISHVLGQVQDPAIVRVHITWKDGQVQDADVVNGSFIAIRSGQVELSMAEGLDTASTLVYQIAH